MIKKIKKLEKEIIMYWFWWESSNKVFFEMVEEKIVWDKELEGL